MSSTSTRVFKVGIGRFVQQDFNQKAYVRAMRLALLHQYTRLAGLRVSMKEHHGPFFKNYTFFIRHQWAMLNEDIISDMIPQPIHGLYSVTYLGSSSILCKSQIILEKQQKCISTCIAQAVCVSLQNRKPVSFPVAIKEIYSYAALGARPQIAPLLATPEPTQQQIGIQKAFIGETDVDENGHTNNTAYLQFCSDVARKAATDKMFTYVTPDILDSRLKKYTIHYIGETVQGDEVTFTSWQDLQNEYLLHFEAKKDDRVIIRCQFGF
ncbi:uncharacterized protein LOC117115158 isoform X2 [Anneissia japonica]|uniref:uncharacterized protein LOC117115158 isoform X2 n=1 Tax=Anneissia japonica TaxID=1529436 RepID=UPI0014259A37|nr:uncharacterized protein LOC117115158 isoform X2 [Anneissia japonica]